MLWNNKNNQKGVAMVSTIIIITLLAIMSATLLQMSYLSYTRKVTERRSNETFYSAESCIDTIKTAVQNKVAAEIEKAKDGTDAFINAADVALSESSLGMPLYDYLYNQMVWVDGKVNGTLKNDSMYYNGYMNGDFTTIKEAISSVDDGGYGGSFTIGNVEKDFTNNSLRIHDVHIKFVNKQGYVAEISTDIVVNAPKYAQDIQVPVGSYSMFAGSGVTMKGAADYSTATYNAQNKNYGTVKSDNAVYLHQEGNVYFGYGTNTNKYGKAISSALYLEPNGTGGDYFSIGGTKAVFNGDVYVMDGSTLIFTGGDGTEDAYVQVNGTIYLSKGATLLLAKNVMICCQDIEIIDDETAETWTYTPYTGVAASDEELDDGLSQFYPLANSATVISKMGTTYSANYLTNKADVAQCIYAAGGKKILNEDTAEREKTNPDRSKFLLDDRAFKVGLVNAPKKQACGIYILKSNRDATGWKRGSADKYYLIKKAGGTGNVYRLADSAITGVYNNNLYVNPNDVNLKLDAPVMYGEAEVDYEFAQIFNMPMLDLWKGGNNTKLYNYILDGYNTTDSSKYTYDYFLKNEKSATSVGLKKLLEDNSLSNVSDAIYWSQILSANDDTDQLLGLRKFRIPKSTTKSATLTGQNCAALKITLKDGTVYTPGELVVGTLNGGNINPGNLTYNMQMSETEIQVHATGSQYIGIFLSAKNVTIGQSVGVTRGISLLEAATLTAHPGLSNSDNEVRKLLEIYSGSVIPQDFGVSSIVSGKGNNKVAVGVALFDNLFNGGVESFWKTRSSSGSIAPSGDSNNADFIEMDDYTTT